MKNTFACLALIVLFFSEGLFAQKKNLAITVIQRPAVAVANTFYTVNKGSTPDIWPNMIMLWTMQSYYEYSRDARVIPFMTKYFKWQTTVPEDQLLKLYWENSRGGDNLYSIYWLYNRTGEKWLLDLANKIHRNTADWAQSNNLPNWHNVNVAQCFREPATYYMQAKDSS